LAWIEKVVDALEDSLEIDEHDSHCSYLLDSIELQRERIVDIRETKMGKELSINHITSAPMSASWIFICRPRRSLLPAEESLVQKLLSAATINHCLDQFQEHEEYLSKLLTQGEQRTQTKGKHSSEEFKYLYTHTLLKVHSKTDTITQ